MVVLAGPDEHGLGAALADRGAEVARVEDVATRTSLADAGVERADLFVLTDMADATAIPVALDVNPDLRVVTYATESLPEFARGQADLAVDPALLPTDVVAAELTG